MKILGWGWGIYGAPECPAWDNQGDATRYAELRTDGLTHLEAWDRVQRERSDRRWTEMAFAAKWR